MCRPGAGIGTNVPLAARRIGRLALGIDFASPKMVYPRKGPDAVHKGFRMLTGATLLLAAVSATAGTAGFRQAVEEFAGQPVVFDPRISVPDCASAMEFSWSSSERRGVVASCAAAGWRLVLPVAGGGARQQGVTRNEAPVIRRGDLVQVTARGANYAIYVDAVAEGSGRPGGRMLVRNLRTGARIPVEVGADGTLTLSAFR